MKTKEQLQAEIIEKQKELIDFYELLFDGDTLQHIHEEKLRKELSALTAEPEKGRENNKSAGIISGGWECPRCGQINAIWKSVCDCPPRTITATTVNGTYNPDSNNQ